MESHDIEKNALFVNSADGNSWHSSDDDDLLYEENGLSEDLLQEGGAIFETKF